MVRRSGCIFESFQAVEFFAGSVVSEFQARKDSAFEIVFVRGAVEFLFGAFKVAVHLGDDEQIEQFFKQFFSFVVVLVEVADFFFVGAAKTR